MLVIEGLVVARGVVRAAICKLDVAVARALAVEQNVDRNFFALAVNRAARAMHIV